MSSSSEQKFQKDKEYRLHRLRHFAKKYGWKELAYHKEGILVLQKEKKGISIDVDNIEILTSLIHPKNGYTSLHRSGNLTQRVIESIFRNPRQHMKRKIVKSRYVK